MSRAIEAHLNLPAFQANLHTVRRHAPAARVLAVIKADGYGHGLLRAARALQQADAFGVAAIDEALALRAAGIDHPIVLLEGFFEAAELAEIAAWGLSTVVHHEWQLAALEAARLPAPVAVILKIDSGMHRLGFAPGESGAAYERLMSCPAVAEIQLMTHLACADERDNTDTLQQIDCFAAASAGLAGARSIANSAAILQWPASHGDWVRPGIMLYGVSPFADSVGEGEGLTPVMTLKSHLISVRQCRRGDAIGYGGIWHCPEDMPLGVVAAGYGDGYPRSARSGTPVLVNGRRVPLVGRVSMDMLCVDLRSQPGAAVGDEVVLWGAALPVEEVARSAGTIGYELLCGVTRRVRFVEQGMIGEVSGVRGEG
ncbi:MAG: alanine racemase [Gammaproteobacteria bacterium]